MKFIITSIFFNLLSITIYAQIKMTGTKEVLVEKHDKVEFVSKEVLITKIIIENKVTTPSIPKDPEYNYVTYPVKTETTKEVEEEKAVEVEKVKDTNKSENTANNATINETPNEIEKAHTEEVTLPHNEKAPTSSKNNPKQIVVDLNEPTLVTTSSNKKNQQSENTSSSGLLYGNDDVNSSSTCNYKNLNSWAIGLQFGSAFIQGDVRSKIGYGGAIHFQKGLSNRFSLRYQGMYLQAFGQDWKIKSNSTTYSNYKSRISDHSIQAIVLLNEKNSRRIQFNLIAGAGFSTKISWTNAYDANGNMYDYSSVIVPTSIKDKGEVLESINSIQDNGYETIIAADQLTRHIKNTEINPSIILGLGANIKLSNKIALNIEHRVSWHNTDNLDNLDMNLDDFLHFSSLGLQFTLGKNENSLWWKNNSDKCCNTTDKTTITSAKTNNEIEVSNESSSPVITKVEPIIEEPVYVEENIIGYIFFDTNSSKIKEEYFSELYKLNLLFEQDPNIKIQIIGHADVHESESKNKNISVERANSLFHFLTGILKMDPAKFEVSSLGENNFTVPAGFEVDAKNISQMNKSITLIYKQ